MKKFNKKLADNEPTLPLLRQTHELAEIQHGLEHKWGPKVVDNMQWSDPVREKEFLDFIDGSKQAIANSIVKETELNMYQSTRDKELNKRKLSRRRLNPETGRLGLSKEHAD